MQLQAELAHSDEELVGLPLLEASLKDDTDGIFSSQKHIADRILDRLFIITGTAACFTNNRCVALSRMHQGLIGLNPCLLALVGIFCGCAACCLQVDCLSYSPWFPHFCALCCKITIMPVKSSLFHTVAKLHL